MELVSLGHSVGDGVLNLEIVQFVYSLKCLATSEFLKDLDLRFPLFYLLL